MEVRMLSNTTEWDDVLATGKRQWVFKHSNSCSISFMAEEQVMGYFAAHPEQELAVVVVQEARPVSNKIAEDLGRVHKSPQLFLIDQGQVVWEASHWSIKTAAMAEAWQS